MRMNALEPMDPRHRAAIVVRVLKESSASLSDDSTLSSVAEHSRAVVGRAVLMRVDHLRVVVIIPAADDSRHKLQHS